MEIQGVYIQNETNSHESKIQPIDATPETGSPEEFEDVEITIPVLPRGKIICLCILSTWGDSNYVGLNGIEFWNREGIVSSIVINWKF